MNFSEGDFVLVAREDFFAGGKLCWRWRGPHRVDTPLNDYMFKVEDLTHGSFTDVHGSRLKFYSDSLLDTKAIMSHVLKSETGIPCGSINPFYRKRWRSRGFGSLERTWSYRVHPWTFLPDLRRHLSTSTSKEEATPTLQFPFRIFKWDENALCMTMISPFLVP